MFALLLLASSAAAEWVEISQNHYRKEPARRVTVRYEDTAAANKIYNNYTLKEPPWNQEVVTRSSHRGNVKRVQFPFKPKDKFSNGILSEANPFTERTNTNRESVNFGPVRTSNIKKIENFEIKHIKGKHSERGNFKDESITINEKSIRLREPAQWLKNPTPNIAQHFKENDHKRFEENKNVHDDDDGNRSIKPILYNVSNSKRLVIIRHSNEDFNNYSKETDTKESTYINDNFMSIDGPDVNKPKDRTYNIANYGNVVPKDSFRSHNTLSNNKHKHQNIQKTEDIHINEINKSFSHKEPEKESEQGNPTKIIKEPNFQRKHLDDDKRPDLVNQDEFTRKDDNLGKSSKGNSIEVIWKIMKLVTDNISRNTRRSFRSKVRYLEGLRNTILENIEDRIEEVWPDEAEGGGRRRRSPAADARGHVEFPSSESALMTISFLTFAVFLIKLVLQVIHTYKNKTMMVTPAVVAAVGRAAATLTQQLPRN